MKVEKGLLKSEVRKTDFDCISSSFLFSLLMAERLERRLGTLASSWTTLTTFTTTQILFFINHLLIQETSHQIASFPK